MQVKRFKSRDTSLLNFTNLVNYYLRPLALVVASFCGEHFDRLMLVVGHLKKSALAQMLSSYLNLRKYGIALAENGDAFEFQNCKVVFSLV